MNYQTFKEMLKYGEEFEIVYKEKTYWLSQRTDLQKLFFTKSPDDYMTFNTAEEVLSARVLDGKTIKELWEELDVY